MKLHFGEPKHRGVFRFFTGTTTQRGKSETYHYFQHPIRSMFGISGSKARWFFGIIMVDGTRTLSSSEPPNRE